MRTYSVIPAIAALMYFEMRWPKSIEFDEHEHPVHRRRINEARALRDRKKRRKDARKERHKTKEELRQCQE